MDIEHGDDNQHHEPERGMEDITAKSAGNGRPESPDGSPGTSHIVSEPEPMFR